MGKPEEYVITLRLWHECDVSPYKSAIQTAKRMGIEDHLYGYLPSYKSAPALVKKGAALLYNRLPKRLRYGRMYEYHSRILDQAKTWNKERLEAYQLACLNVLLQEAKKHTVHYAQVLAQVPLPIHSLAEFEALVPFSTKQQLRQGAQRFRSRQFDDQDVIEISTGGTTGEPLRLYYEKGGARTKEWIYMHDLWNRVGYQPGDSRAVFRSALVRGRSMDQLWEYDPINNRHFFSSYDLSEQNIARYVNRLREIKPKYLHVYPSVLTIIASHMKARGLPPIPGVQGILSGSENTYPHQIKLFEDVFQCRVMRWYGLGEMSALAGATEYDYNYHVYPTYSYVELVDEEGRTVKNIGERGEIIGTAFDNFAMPLIRYRTGDYAIYGGEDRLGPVFSEIEGRAQEHVVDAKGNLLSLGPFIFGIHEAFWHNVSGIQFVQKEAGHLIVLGRSATLSDAELEDYLLRTFSSRLSNRFQFTVRTVDEFERTQLGKHRYLIQELDVAASVPWSTP